jgi:AraC-like DNA-binding protein
MISLALSLAGKRLHAVSPSMVSMIENGRLSEAVASGRNLLDQGRNRRHPEVDVIVGQATMRALMALERDEEAEELMHRMLKTYDGLRRNAIRAHTAVDQAVFMLHLNRPARATQLVTEIADDTKADPNLRAEVLLLLSHAYLSLGRPEDALRALEAAKALAMSAALPAVAALIELTQLGAEVSMNVQSAEELSDHDHHATSRNSALRPRSNADLDADLAAAQARFGADSLAGHRATQLRSMLAARPDTTKWLHALQSELAWIRRTGMRGIETPFRLEAAMTCLGANHPAAAAEFLQPMTYDEQKLVRHRFAPELEYCLSKLHVHRGRHSDALRYYKLYSNARLDSLRNESATLRAPRCMAAFLARRPVDNLEARLPARYRRGYRYLIDHLDQPELSVRQIAAQIGVTERALQLAFHKHLGMTPAEVIRERRMAHIHAELSEAGSQEGVLEVAARWGVTNRSTLAHRYRQIYAQTPSETRGVRVRAAERGATPDADMLPVSNA